MEKIWPKQIPKAKKLKIVNAKSPKLFAKRLIKKLKKEQVVRALKSFLIPYQGKLDLVWHNRCGLADHLFSYSEETRAEFIEFMLVKDIRTLDRDVSINCFIPVCFFDAKEVPSKRHVKVVRVSVDEFIKNAKNKESV